VNCSHSSTALVFPAEVVMDASEKTPVWLTHLFAFIAGVVIAAAWFAPTFFAPDYQRGHADGYRVGYKEGQISMGASAPEHGVK
jgi:hypothetical protein